MKPSRLDILLYAHDGRGLGHASRSIAIGMALRRLYPELRVLLVTGCRQAGGLIDRAPLDWLKLPSYETRIEQGVSRGIDGRSGFPDRELAALRARTLEDIVRLYRPRLLLADHQPQGKHRELLPALAASDDTIGVLGLRGVVGGVQQLQSDIATRCFARHYRALLWYGDSRVLGSDHLRLPQEQFGCRAVECGYVSRMAELAPWHRPADDLVPPLAGTISLPWLGEDSHRFLAGLAAALGKVGPGHGRWRIFTDPDNRPLWQLFAALDHCSIEPPGPRYIDALLNSRMAVIYGGYNSLIDVLATGRPAVVLVRPMQDEEQRLHLELLCARTGPALVPVAEEDISAGHLAALLADQLQRPARRDTAINLDGAARAARELARLLKSRKS